MAQMYMKEREILDDVLTSQKSIANTYNISADECSTPLLRDGLLDILTEEHQIHADVFNEMNRRGWFPVQQADEQKIEQTKQKFKNCKP